MDIKLDTLIPAQRMTPAVAVCMTYGFAPVNIPTEAVVTEPRFVVPRQARVYNTDLYVFDDGRVVPYHTLMKLRGADFRGTAHECPVSLIEVWDDFGADGHTSWSLMGWKYIVAKTFGAAAPADRLGILRATDEDHEIYSAARRAALDS